MKQVSYYLKFYLTFFIYITLNYVYGQLGGKLQVSVPKSPTASAFEKYINYPISKFTGLPNVTQSLYTINQDGVIVDISLKYHASGLRVKDPGGPVGLGWDLLAGGAINREIRGIRDEREDFNGYLYRYSDGHRVADDIIRFANINYSTCSESDRNFYENFVYRVWLGNVDTEPDIFTFNILGKSGKFVFNRQGIPIMLRDDLFKITGNIEDGFIITDKEGNRYFFNSEDAERSAVITHSFGTQGVDEDDLNDYISTWKLSKIVTFKGNEIIFTYEDFIRDMPPTLVQKMIYKRILDPGTTEHDELTILGRESTTEVHEKLLKRIEFRKGTIIFDYDSDLRNILKEVRLININGQLVFKKQFHFYPYNRNELLSGESRILLKEIVQEKNGETIPIVGFTYYPGNFPPFNSKGIDDWGFYNGKINNRSLISRNRTHIDYIVNNNNNSTPHQLINYFNYWAADRDPVFATTKIGMLKDIIYPTKGRTTLEYELNQLDSNNILGGLRIKRITHFDANGTIVQQKEYEYATTPQAIFPFGKMLWGTSYSPQPGSPCPGTPRYNIYHLYSDPKISLNTSFGNSIVYTQVTEKFINGNENQKVKTYYNFWRGYINLIGATSLYDDYKNGLILKEELIDTQNNVVQETTNHYEFVGNQFSEPIIGVVLFMNEYYLACDGSIARPVYEMVNKQVYQYTQNNIARKTSTITHLNQENITTEYSYLYDNNSSLLIEENFRGSRNELVRKQYFYPKDLLSANLYAYAHRAIVTMYQQNRNIPILTIKYAGTPSETAKTSYRLDYRLINGRAYPFVLYYSKGSDPLEPRINYWNYDDNGNLIEVGKVAGPHTYYIYGYNNTLPIAKIINFSRTQINTHLQTLINAAIIASNNDVDEASEETLRNALNTLRQSLPNNTQITTYTYDPLIGVTSITDPKGDTEYYIYDNMNRLKYIKDKDGNIRKEYQYHYANQ